MHGRCRHRPGSRARQRDAADGARRVVERAPRVAPPSAVLAEVAPVSPIAAPPERSPPAGELPPYASAAELLIAALHADASAGLSDRDAAVRLADTGPNIAAPARRPAYLRIAARQFADPLVALLIAAALVSAGIGERFEGAVIAADRRAQRHSRLRTGGGSRAGSAGADPHTSSSWPTSSGRGPSERCLLRMSSRAISSIVREGDRVPADARIVGAERLAVDESLAHGRVGCRLRRTRMPSRREPRSRNVTRCCTPARVSPAAGRP